LSSIRAPSHAGATNFSRTIEFHPGLPRFLLCPRIGLSLTLLILKTLQHIFSRYTAFLWALLKPLGAWGIVAAAAIDGAFVGLPVDAIVAGYVYHDNSRFLIYVLMASAGSTLGSLVVYVIGYQGGEELLRKRISAQRFEKLHTAFDHHPFWSLMLPAMLPPPTPFKLFALAAAISEMGLAQYVLAIFFGRVIRFLLLALLTMKLGPGAVHLFGMILRKHLALVMLAIAAMALIWLIYYGLRTNKFSSSRPENSH
jgi:membrane protein YqaA with SNARE-associated domain